MKALTRDQTFILSCFLLLSSKVFCNATNTPNSSPTANKNTRQALKKRRPAAAAANASALHNVVSPSLTHLYAGCDLSESDIKKKIEAAKNSLQFLRSFIQGQKCLSILSI